MDRKLIDAYRFEEELYHEAFERDSDMQRWDSGCWIRYKLFERMLEKQPAVDVEPHWIPCSERLPEAPFGCLVTVEDEEPMTGALFPNLLPYFVGWDGEQWNDADGEQCPFEVLAWMPLPDPYEVEK